jgi:hypothetical protein
MAQERLSNLSPDDQYLRYWTRQGISLQEVLLLIGQAKISALQAQAALDAFTEGALSGVTELGQQLITATDQTAAKAALGITGSGGSGASSIDELTGIVDPIKTALKAPTPGGALTNLGGVAQSELGIPSGVAKLDIDGDVIDASGNKVAAPIQGLQDQLDTSNQSLADKQAQLDAITTRLATTPTALDIITTPMFIRYGTGWPARPATPRPIVWVGGPSSPPLTGTTTGGGGMADIDFWFG